MKKPIWVLCVAWVLIAFPLTASAQTNLQAFISPPDTTSFPILQSQLTVYDAAGQFVSGLTPADILVYENNQEITLRELSEIEPGLQLVVAINPSPTFSTRDSNAATRYDYIAASLAEWSGAQADNQNDVLSLITSELGTLQTPVNQSASYADLQAAILAGMTKDYRSEVPGLQVLSEALTIAAETPQREGMGQAILLITPHIESDDIVGIEALTGRALQDGIQVYVWMITSEAYFTNSGGLALETMARATGGAVFGFSGDQPIPDPETYFNPLRRAYLFSYETGIRAPGEQELSVAVNVAGESIRTNPAKFDLNVQPPNAILVSPPTEIFRNLTEETTNERSVYNLNEQMIDILVEFPDGFPREIVSTRLYIDGAVVAENTAPPFEQFTWNLAEVAESTEFMMQVEAVDSLGMSSLSLAKTVTVNVQQIPAGFFPAFTESRPAIISVAVAIAAIVLLTVFVRIGRSRSKTETKVASSKDPVFQQVNTEEELSPRYRIRNLTNRLNWPQRPNREPYAYLEKIIDPDSFDTLTPSKPIPIHLTSTSLGTDPNKVDLPIEEPSMEAVHAHIQRNRDGHFYLKDNESTGGSWINYQPTNGNPVKIEHGDLVHFGRIGFRFKLSKPPKVYSPIILPGDNKR